MKLNKFQLFNNAYVEVEVIGSQLQQNVEESKNMIIRREVEKTTKKEDNLGNKKRWWPQFQNQKKDQKRRQFLIK
jgi:hypothetical protein